MSDWDPNHENETLTRPKLGNMNSQFDTWVLDIETRTMKMKHSLSKILSEESLF